MCRRGCDDEAGPLLILTGFALVHVLILIATGFWETAGW
jgi:hypothetical protein